MGLQRLRTNITEVRDNSSLTSWRRQWQPAPVLLPGKSHGQRSLVGYGLWGFEELDTTEQLHFHFSLSCTGEGNVNPLQCSCLENPGKGAWGAAIYGVAQSRTQLMWFSSSSRHYTKLSWSWSSDHIYIQIYICIFQVKKCLTDVNYFLNICHQILLNTLSCSISLSG